MISNRASSEFTLRSDDYRGNGFRSRLQVNWMDKHPGSSRGFRSSHSVAQGQVVDHSEILILFYLIIAINISKNDCL